MAITKKGNLQLGYLQFARAIVHTGAIFEECSGPDVFSALDIDISVQSGIEENR